MSTSESTGSSVAVDRRAPASLRLSTTLRRVSASRSGTAGATSGGEVTRGHQHPAAASAARRSSGAKDMRSGSSSELASSSSWGPPAEVLDLRKAPRRVSTWSNNSGTSNGSGGSGAISRNRNNSTGGSSTASGSDVDADAEAAGRRGPPLMSTVSAAKANAAGAGRVRNRSTSSGGGGAGALGSAKRVSTGRQLVGGVCQRCGVRRAEDGGQEEAPCDGCGAADFAAEDAERQRGAARPRGRRSGASAVSHVPGLPTVSAIVSLALRRFVLLPGPPPVGRWCAFLSCCCPGQLGVEDDSGVGVRAGMLTVPWSCCCCCCCFWRQHSSQHSQGPVVAAIGSVRHSFGLATAAKVEAL